MEHVTITNTTINMTAVDASHNPEKNRHSCSFKNSKPRLKVGDYVKKADKRNIFSRGYTSNWYTELVKINQVLKIQPPI